MISWLIILYWYLLCSCMFMLLYLLYHILSFFLIIFCSKFIWSWIEATPNIYMFLSNAILSSLFWGFVMFIICFTLGSSFVHISYRCFGLLMLFLPCLSIWWLRIFGFLVLFLFSNYPWLQQRWLMLSRNVMFIFIILYHNILVMLYDEHPSSIVRASFS